MIGIVQATGVGEVRRPQMERRRLLVHEVEELRPVHDARRDRLGRVVAGVEQHALEQLADGQLLAGADAHVVWFDLGRGDRHRDDGVQRRKVRRHHRGHHLGQGRLRISRPLVLLVEDLSSCKVDDDRRPSLDRRRLGDGMGPQPVRA